MAWKRLTFILSLVLALIAIPLLATAQNGETVSAGDSLTAELTLENPSATYTILAAQGDRLLLTLRSSDFDSYLTLLDQDGNLVAEDDDSAGGKDALIDAELPSTGLYTIQASSYNQASTGTFSLTVAGSISQVPTATPVPTQAPLEQVAIVYGQSMDGSLTGSEAAAEFTFEGQQGERVTITLISEDFDAYLTLADESGAEIVADDDSAGNLNARIEDFELPASGTYLIRAGSYGGGAVGSFTLTLESASGQVQGTATPPPDTTPVAQNGDSLTYGTTVEGTLTEGATSATYSFEGQAGDRVTITLTSPDFDAYLRLSQGGATPLVEDDDSAGNLNARIQDFELPSTGGYTIEVSSLSGVAGAYTLTLEGESSGVIAEATPVVTEVTPVAGDGSQTVAGLLSHDLLSATYPFAGRAGDTIAITMTSTEFDSYLLLQDSSGETLVEDDDSAGNLNAEIVYTLPEDGEYALVATSNTRGSTGSYVLSVVGIETELTLNAPHLGLPEAPFNDPVNIDLGGTVSSEFNRAAGGNGFSFTGEAGQTVTVTVSSNDFDPMVTLYQMTSGTFVDLISDDDSAGNLNARIENFTLPEQGTYLIAVTDAGQTGTGTFTLELEDLGITSIAVTPAPTEIASSGGDIQIGSIVDGTLPETNAATYTFEGQEGQSVTILVTSSDFDPFVSLADSSGRTLTSDDDSAGNLNALIESYVLREAGRYSLVVSNVGGSAGGTFTLELSGDGGVIEQPGSDTLTPGTTLDGELTLDQPAAIYFFEGEAGQTVTIVATSNEFDAFLTLSGSAGNVLVSDDDSAGNLNARIDSFTLPANDTYTITVSSFTEGVSGAFTLVLESGGSGVGPTPEPTEIASGDNIVIGQVVDGTLRAGQSSTTYTFEGRTGQALTIIARSEAFDTYLRVSDSDGVELAYDDDSGGNLDSRIGVFQPYRDDTYTITVESYDGVAGDFTLEVLETTISYLAFREPLERTLEVGEIDIYRFEGQAGDVVVINLTGTFDTYLTLADESGLSLIENDDSINSTNSSIGPYTLPQDGTYFVYVRSYDTTAIGDYTVSLNRAEPIRLSYGEDINAVFEAEGGAMYFDFEGSYGDVITIRANSDDTLDTSLTLVGPDGYQLVADADGGAGHDPEILDFALNQDGVYIIGLSTAVPGDTGQVTLTLQKSEARTLDEGSQEVSLNDQRTQDFVSFNGQAGEKVLLTVEVLTPPSTYSPYITVEQSDQTLYYGYGAFLSRQVIELTIPADGEVIIKLEYYDTGEARMRLTLERLSS